MAVGHTILRGTPKSPSPPFVIPAVHFFCSSNSEPPEGNKHVCLWIGCTSKYTFKRAEDLDRHQKTHHMSSQTFYCPIAGCERSAGFGFRRADKRNEHLRAKHADLGY